MKVRLAFEFDEDRLRTIRALLGRGGRATRKECVYFVERTVRDTLAKAPPPRAKRRRVVKRETPPGLVATGSETPEEAVSARERIRKLYRS